MEVIKSSPVQDCSGMENDRGNDAAKLSNSKRKKIGSWCKKKLDARLESSDKREDTENPESKREVPHRNADIIIESSIQNDMNAGLGTAVPVDQKRTVSSAAATGYGKTSISKRKGCTEIVKGEEGSSRTATVDVKIRSKREEHMEIANDMTGSSTNKSLDAKDTMSKRQQHMTSAIGETVSSGTAIIDANTGSKSEKDMETASCETISGKFATPDAKMVSKRKKHTEVANGEMGSGTTNNLNVNGAVKKKGELLNPPCLEDMGTANGETDSGRTATDNTASKKKKKRKLKNKNPASGALLSTQDGTQDMVTEKKDTNRSEVLEAMCGESIPGKTATPDAKMLSKGEHTKVANDEMVSSTTKNLDLNDTVKKGKKQTAKNRRPTLGEILNPRYLQDLETATIAANNKKSEKRKRQKLKKQKLVLDEILTTCESTQDMVVAKKDSGTNNVREATSTESNEALTRKMQMQTQGSNKEKTINVIAHVPTLEKKLIIFDVNGLLADIVSPPPKGVKADKNIPKRAIFKRPFLDDFLCFCFERFKVGIWSSRTKKVLDPVVKFLLGDLRTKLLFVWDASECTRSWKKTLEDKHKCIVFKDLRKIWTRNGPGGAWVKGVFNESNTLLVDDSPYKALLNPKHTGIFPAAYSYQNTDDNFLGPNGDLRTYLEGVAATDNLKTYVEQHPFGQGAIDESSPHWGFYSRLLKGQS